MRERPYKTGVRHPYAIAAGIPPNSLPIPPPPGAFSLRRRAGGKFATLPPATHAGITISTGIHISPYHNEGAGERPPGSFSRPRIGVSPGAPGARGRGGAETPLLRRSSRGRGGRPHADRSRSAPRSPAPAGKELSSGRAEGVTHRITRFTAAWALTMTLRPLCRAHTPRNAGKTRAASSARDSPSPGGREWRKFS